jgi:hypothetical protein
MTHREYKKWKETDEIRYFKCNGYHICRHLDGLSPHRPLEEGWMACTMDSGLGFTCGVVTRACGYKDTTSTH